MTIHMPNKSKPLFKAEMKHIRKLRDALNYSIKLNGSKVILHDENCKFLHEVVLELDKAELILSKIN
jgi:hypothetical protein